MLCMLHPQDAFRQDVYHLPAPTILLCMCRRSAEWVHLPTWSRQEEAHLDVSPPPPYDSPVTRWHPSAARLPHARHLRAPTLLSFSMKELFFLFYNKNGKVDTFKKGT